MKYSEIAKQIATKAHKGQKRWDGKPYITHPEAVASNFDDEVLKSIAWLHDVVEDTDIDLTTLACKNFPGYIIYAIDKLTRKKDETYLDFILRVKTDENATAVKIADINHNLSDLKEGSLKDKYRLALYILEN